MDFKLVIVVLLAYFIRPQDWLPGMSGINIMKPLMAMAMIAMFTRRRGFSARSLVKSPIDWAIIAYALYIVFSAPDGVKPFSGVLVLISYYFVVSQALTTPFRLNLFLKVWFFALITVAGMAVLSEYGLDLTGAKDITHKIPDKPRLVLNTYLFSNPNSLGHSVVLALPLAYFVMMWRRPTSRKLLGILLLLLAAYCVYLTASKGSYIVGFMVITASLIVGRSRIVQLIAILLAATLGWAGLSQLPRMTQLDNARQDEAIMGRMLAWEQARITCEEKKYGEGWKNFTPMIEFEDGEVLKATHSAYVLVGAELGKYGMFFYVAVLYASLRALFSCRCRRASDERSRMILMILLLGYMISAWMIDRSYHLEYFLMAGAISGLHRRMGVETGIVSSEGEELDLDQIERDHNEDEDDEEEELTIPEPLVDPVSEFGSGPQLAYGKNHQSPQADEISDATIGSIDEFDSSAFVEEAIEDELAKRSYWSRIGILDILLAYAFSRVIFAVWDYILEHYFI